MRRRWQAVLLAGTVALLGLTASGVTVALLQRQQQQHAAETLNRHTDLVRRAVVEETRRYEDALRDLAAALAAHEELTAADFMMITSAVTRQRLSGATGVSFAVPTRPGQVAGVQAAWRRQGSTGLTLRPAATGRPDHRFAVVSRSLDPGTSVLGRDLTESQQSVEAMDLARRTGAPAASHTYVLLRDRALPPAQRQLSFQLTTPVSVRAGGRVWAGWLIMAMRGRDFLVQTLRQVALEQVRVLLLDEDRAGVPSTPVATWPTRAPADTAGPRARAVRVPVAQREWTLLVRPTAALGEGAITSVPLLAGAAGALVTALLSGLVLVLGWSRQRALVAVAEATAALHADIVRREAVEARLRRREAELRGFAGVAAHDLKAPLAVTGGRLELLEDDLGEDMSQAARRDLGRARDGLARMDRLISDLLAYATADEAEPRRERVDLAAVVAEVLAERSGGAGPPGVTVGTLPAVVGDQGMLRQLFTNLIGNALKYVAPGQSPVVTVAAAPVPGGWGVTVADRGIGVPAAQRAVVFDAFQRADSARSYPGTGLGLAICHRIVERHGGAIGVTENPGGGSVFWFTLPAEPVADRPAGAPRAGDRVVEPAGVKTVTNADAGEFNAHL